MLSSVVQTNDDYDDNIDELSRMTNFLHFTVTYLVFVYFQPLLLLQLWLFHTTDFCGDVINGVSDSWCSFPKGSGYGTVKTVPLFWNCGTVNGSDGSAIPK